MNEKKIIAWLGGEEKFENYQEGLQNFWEFPSVWYRCEPEAREFLARNSKLDEHGVKWTRTYIAPMYSDGTFGKKIYE